jgi:hypothetical protein
MTTGQDNQSKDVLKSLTLDIEGSQLSFDKFLKAQEYLSKLLHEVDRAVREATPTAIADQKRPTIDWIISQVSGGSVHLTLEGMTKEEVKPSHITQVLQIVETGISTIVNYPERPHFFSDRALENVKFLAKLVEKDVFMIQLSVNSQRVTLNEHLIANVDEIIGGKYRSFGSVEGILKAIDLSRQPVFRVYDLLTNKSVRCYFNSDTLDIIKDALEKRVSVSGWINSREDGEKISIQVEEIDIFPSEDELPTIEEMIGILG